MSEVMYARPLVRAESVIQAVPTAYDEMYGRKYFECAPLRSKLSVDSCADNYLRGKCLVCLDCRTGKHHAAGARPAVPTRQGANADVDGKSLRQILTQKCVRCGCSAGRLITKGWCVSCFNRQREVVIGKNGKGKFPRQAGAVLRRVVVAVNGPDSLETDLYPQGCPKLENGLPQFERISRGAWLVSAVCVSADELLRTLDRVADVDLVDFEEGPTFLEMYLARDTAH